MTKTVRTALPTPMALAFRIQTTRIDHLVGKKTGIVTFGIHFNRQLTLMGRWTKGHPGGLPHGICKGISGYPLS
jgi:hypothetical protein